MLDRKTVLLASVLAGVVLACGPEASNTTGSGGSGGAGGSGGVGGGTPVDPPGPKDPDDLLKAAILMGSCVPDSLVDNWLRDFYAERGVDTDLDVLSYTKCLASKTNGCKAIEECLGVTVDLSGPCMPTCTGNVLKVCDDQLAFTVDCSVVGRECSEEARDCVDKSIQPGATCNDETFKEVCQDGVPRVCSGELETNGPACADFGLTCKDLQFGGVGCVGTGATCQSDTGGGLTIDYSSGLTCDGPELRACINGGEQAVDCDKLVKGSACNSSGASYFCGFGSACDPFSGDNATCEGDSIVVCHAGRIDKVDCKTLGFTGCNATWGTCSPSIYDQAPPPDPDPGPGPGP
ncbi:hypothetical protein [Polyangium mundeleinium]|uniref:Lipoprotein n=1 Tax=Polyangium mundeleinium TaxID=2995306 RepID=A0ABT5EG66_9BACT|nr:hypothetical protein [Polyangium mundeleinium]MDC0740332.1 hypothetical protein [Polyangium mundeleinium]